MRSSESGSELEPENVFGIVCVLITLFVGCLSLSMWIGFTIRSEACDANCREIVISSTCEETPNCKWYCATLQTREGAVLHCSCSRGRRSVECDFITIVFVTLFMSSLACLFGLFCYLAFAFKFGDVRPYCSPTETWQNLIEMWQNLWDRV